jgi:hypothetical protein
MVSRRIYVIRHTILAEIIARLAVVRVIVLHAPQVAVV